MARISYPPEFRRGAGAAGPAVTAVGWCPAAEDPVGADAAEQVHRQVG